MTAPAAAVAVGRALYVADAELLHLGAELERAWAHEQTVVERFRGDRSPEADAIVEGAYDACESIVDQIEAIRATTLDGVRVKALATSWCHSGEEITGYGLNEQQTTNVRLAASVLRDILAIGRA